jgi:RpiR family transcriptional regulator, carbohydrate utilization regulator
MRRELVLEKSLMGLIRVKYNTFSASQKIVADYVLEHPNEVMFHTLNGIATACDVSETTVLRFLHKIKFNSYQLFRINLTQELSKGTVHAVYEDVALEDSADQVMQKIIAATINSLKDSLEVIDSECIEHFVKRILSAQRILIIGVGASASVATDLFHKLIKLGFDAVCSNDPHMINIMASNLTEQDFLIVVSHSGESREILDGVTLAKENHCTVGAITSYLKSTLANESDGVLCSSSLETKFRSDAMTSRIIQIVIIDILYVSIVAKLGDAIIPQIYKTRVAVAKNKT